VREYSHDYPKRLIRLRRRIHGLHDLKRPVRATALTGCLQVSLMKGAQRDEHPATSVLLTECGGRTSSTTARRILTAEPSWHSLTVNVCAACAKMLPVGDLDPILSVVAAFLVRGVGQAVEAFGVRAGGQEPDVVD
jgi:hypothetical protein